MDKEINITLSGRAIRGFYHIGFLKAIDDLNLKVNTIVGTSIGSLIGVFYSAGWKAEELEELVQYVKFRGYFLSTLTKHSLLKLKIDELIKEFISIDRIEKLKTKMIINTFDLKNIKTIFWEEGDIRNLTKASCSFPVIFLPVKYKKYLLTDGGVLNNLPIETLQHQKNKENINIDSNLIDRNFLKKLKTNNIIQIAIKSIYIYSNQKTLENENKFDLVITYPHKPPIFDLKYLKKEKIEKLN